MDAERAQRGIVLIGFMGAGKSTVAEGLAQKTGMPALDSDTLVERHLGKPIAAAFEADGEAAFREVEERIVLELLDDAPAGAIVSLGGGSVLSAHVQEQLASWLTLLVEVQPHEAWQRATAGGDRSRPLAREQDAFLALFAERQPLYERLADARLLWAISASGAYPVIIGDGLIAEEGLSPGGARSAWPFAPAHSRPFCVTDANVAELYGESLRPLSGLVAIAPGESQKTLASAQVVWESLLKAGVTRAGHLLALGGGVVGDLAGFCAATYQRGVPIVQAPSTLVAQVDSAYGGKTGVDLPGGKNYVGAYHQPAGVIVDPKLLATLPGNELNAGWAEVIKTALIAGGPLWERVQAGLSLDAELILACARTKLAIVAADERDVGARQALNLGHTVGHAIETATGYRRYLHGEAVGIGLLAALRLSGADQLRDAVRDMLLAARLPVSFGGASVQAVLLALSRDKKRLAGEVPFVLLSRPGHARVGEAVLEKDVRAAVAELCESQ